MAATEAAAQAGVRHWVLRALIYVVGYNWLITVTILPVPLFIFWTLATARLPIAVVCIAAYIVSEVTVFCAERSWSRVNARYFWQLAAPFCLVQAVLCIRHAFRDPVGCLLFSLMCLGLREALFEFFYAGVAVGGYKRKERATAACIGGFAYSALLVLLSGASYTLVRIAQGRVGELSTAMAEVLYLAVLPSTRALLRMLVTQLTSGLALGPTDGGSEKAGSREAEGPELQGPPLDALVLSSDVAFALTMLLEVPFAFVLLLVPHAATFCVAAATNAACDVLFCYVLDVLQKRRTKFLTASAQAGNTSLEPWAPSFLQERPVSLVAAVLSGGVTAPELHESDRLQSSDRLQPPSAPERVPSPPPPTLGTPRGQQRVCGPLSSERLKTLLSACRSPELCSGRRIEQDACARSGSFSGSGAMSPRVSLLLDEYDAALVTRGASSPSSGPGGGGRAVCLLQDRRAAFTTHLLCNAIAAALAAACAPALATQASVSHKFGWRAAVLLGLRLASDIAACWALDHGGLPGLWESRVEFRTFSGWLYRALVSLCPLFPVLAAESAGRIFVIGRIYPAGG